MRQALILKEGTSKTDLMMIALGFCFCLFPIFILIIPTYTQSACETVKEGYEIYFQRDITPAYLEEANINALKALKNNCPDLNID